MSQTLEIIENHLKEKQTNAIQIVQGEKRYSKNVKHNKFHWTLEDVLNISHSLTDFLKNLPKNGFTSGTKILLKTKYGNGYTHAGETTLMFNSLSEASTPKQELNNMHENQNTISQPQKQPETPQYGLGYVQFPQHELVSMKVKCERYDEMRDKLLKVEQDLLDTKSDLRTEKEETAKLKRSLEFKDERHEIDVQKNELNRKTFFESDQGQTIIQEGIKILPQLAAALKGNKTNMNDALAAPILDDLSESQLLFIEKIKGYSDEIIDVLFSTGEAITNDPSFLEQLKQGLQTV